MHIGAYLKEAQFAVRATQDWPSRLTLLNAMARSHLANWRKTGPNGAAPVSVDLTIGNQVRSVTLRPKHGDLFILYEVLAAETYRLPDAVVAPATVETIIDCGANIGMAALYFAQRYPRARIFCVEPDPDNFALLQNNTRSEPRIVPVQAALIGTGRGPVYLSQDRPAWGNSISEHKGSGQGIEVAGITIAQLCETHGIDRIGLLKVDIEGAEELVFQHPEFLQRVDFLTIELHPPYSIERFRTDVAKQGFVVHPPDTFAGVRMVTASPAKP